MQYIQAIKLTDLLLDIQGLMKVLKPLIEYGQEEFEEFCAKLDNILKNIFPTCTVAFAGPVSSGKSTVLSSLLQQSGKQGQNPIASISPSNETFAPMTITYGEHATLVARYFSIDILNQIQNHLKSLEQNGVKKHLIAQYRDLSNRLLKVGAVLAGEMGREVVRRIDLDGKQRGEILDTIRKHIALSSKSDDVYGVYKAELTYPGDILKELRNVRFIDLYGFGEPSPLISIKYARFLSDEHIDVVVYVFPDRSITEDFNKLFDMPSFLEEIVSKARLFIALNKADAYTDIGPGQWDKAVKQFKDTLVNHTPILRPYMNRIPIFVLSAASIDGKIEHSKVKEIRQQSLHSLQSLRDKVRNLSNQIQLTSSDPSIYLGNLFELLSSLDVLARSVEINLQRVEERIPAISKLVDEMTRQHTNFTDERKILLNNFRSTLKEKLIKYLNSLDYDGLIAPNTIGAPFGHSKHLFRWMLDTAGTSGEKIFQKDLSNIFKNIGKYVDEQLLRAYREYVSIQDNSVQTELKHLSGRTRTSIKPFSVTVDFTAKNLLQFSKDYNFHEAAKTSFNSFLFWYLRNQGKWDAERNTQPTDAKKQIVENIQKSIEIFMRVFIVEDSECSSFLPHICVGGEPTYWRQLSTHIKKLDELLNDQIQISKWKFGLYQNKRFFVSHRPEYQETVRILIAKKNAVEAMIVELA